MTPTARNRLLELLMQGVRPALRGDEPEQTGEILPLARYENGGVFPAVPRALSAIANSAQQGLQTDYMHPDPEIRQSNTRQGIMDALNVAGAAGTGALAMSRPLGSLGAGGVPKSGLDMSHAARMARAKEMGFDTDTVFFHGRNNQKGGAFDGDAFKPSENGNLGAGVYATESPRTASGYSEWVSDNPSLHLADGGQVYPLRIRSEKMAGASDYYSALQAARSQGHKAGDKVRRAHEILKERGFEGIREGANVNVFDPKNIRSINAAFDPAKKDSSDLLAALGLPIIPQDAEKQK